MSFLKNNENQIDIVYTQKGRRYKANNDRRAKIVKWAPSDDGIDYNLYDPNLPVAERSQKILNTPMLGAVTASEATKPRYLLLTKEINTTDGISPMIVEPNYVYMHVPYSEFNNSYFGAPDTKTQTITINAPFPSPNGFIVTLANSKYLYLNEPPVRVERGGRTNSDGRIEFDGIAPLTPPNKPVIARSQIVNISGNDNTIEQTINIEGSQEFPSNFTFKLIYNGSYELLGQGKQHKTKLSIESIDTGLRKDINILLDANNQPQETLNIN